LKLFGGLPKGDETEERQPSRSGGAEHRVNDPVLCRVKCGRRIGNKPVVTRQRECSFLFAYFDT
jgi:hypothetical protein